MLRRDFRYEEEVVDGPGYTIIGGEEGVALLPEESIATEDEGAEEEIEE